MKHGWEIKKLGDIVEIKNGKNQKLVETELGQYKILGSAGNVMGYSSEYICEAGTTIIGRKGNISKPIYINEKFWNVDTAFGLYPKNNFNPKFIYYLCLTVDFAKMNRGTTIPSLVKSEIKEINLKIPMSLPEQERIVSILDKAFFAINQAKQNAEKNLKNAKELFDSYLSGIFTNKGDDWEIKKLGDICENLDSKRVPITKSSRTAGSVPYYGASGIVDYVSNYIFDEDLLCVSEDGANLLARTYPIAFSISGKTWVNNHAHVLRFNNMVTQKFVELYLNSIKLDDYVSGMAQPKLNQTMLNKIPIPTPQLPEQEKLVIKLDDLSKELKQLEDVYQQKLIELEDLKKSILQKAFNGELSI
jgi:type I restriction enzyme S subunit